MIGKLFSAQSKTITGAAIIISAASFASRLVGLLRDHLLANMFGAGHVLDAYYAAFRIPDFIFNIVIIGALSAGMIPLFARTAAKSKSETWLLTNTLLGIVGAATSVLGLLSFIFAPFIMRLIVPGFSAADLALATTLTRIMFLSPILLGLSSIVGSVLQTYKNFFVFSLAPIMYNVGIIIGAIVFVPLFGLYGLAAGVVLGALLHLGVQLPTLFQHGFRFHPIINWRHSAVRTLGTVMVPRMLDLAVAEINFVIIVGFASTLGSGRITMFQYANNLQAFPISLIGIPFAVASFPTLATLAGDAHLAEFRRRLATTIQQILFFIIPLSLLFLLLRAQIVRVVYGSGEFDWTATINTANVLGFFAVSIAAQALMPLLIRAFFALEDTWTPLATSVISMIVNVSSIVLVLHYDIINRVLLYVLPHSELHISNIAGLALAFSFSMLVECTLLWITLRRKVGTLHELTIIKTLAKLFVASIIMGVIVQLLKAPIAAIVDMNKFWGIAIQGAGAGGVGIMVYLLVSYLLNVEQLHQFIQSLTRRTLRLGQTSPEISTPDNG